MTKSELVAKMQEAAGLASGQDGQDRLRRRGRDPARRRQSLVSEDDGAADTTIKVSWDDWQALAAASSTA